MRRPGPTRKSSCLSIERLEERQVLSTLVAAYNFNEGSGTVLHDFSGNGNNGTILNAAWSSAGKYGDALSFNGTSSWVTVADAASLHLTTALTLEAWVYPSALSAWRTVMSATPCSFARAAEAGSC